MAISVTPPMPAEWWLRPVINAWRRGRAERRRVKPVVLQPSAASFSKRRRVARPAEGAGRAEAHVVEQDDQHVGVPAGGRSGSIGGNLVSGSLASYVVSPG